MKYKILVLNLCTFLSFVTNASNASFDLARESFEGYGYRYPELNKFFKRYRCPKSIEDTVLFNWPQMVQNDVLKFGDCYVKANFERIINARRLENYMRSKNFRHLGVAKKYVNKYLSVVAPGIDSKGLTDGQVIKQVTDNTTREIVIPGLLHREDKIRAALIANNLQANIDQIPYTADVKSTVARDETESDFYDLAREALYADFHPGNFVFDGKGKKWILIDTETRSFQGVLIAKKIEDLEIKKYDDPDIDFAKVVKEYRKFVVHRIFDRYMRRVSSSLFLE